MCFVVSMHLYPFDVLVSIGQSNDELGPELDKINITTEDIKNCMFENDTCQGRAVLFSTNLSFLRLRKFPSTSYDHGVLAHEIFHVVTFLFDHIGMKLKINSSDEAYAYAVGYLTEHIYEKLKIKL